MTTIHLSNVKKEPKKRPFRYAFVFTHECRERVQLKQRFHKAGFADCSVKSAKTRAKNGAFVSVWTIPAAPVAIGLFKRVLRTEARKANHAKHEQTNIFINWLIADSKNKGRKSKGFKKIALDNFEKGEKSARSLREKLRKGAYGEKLSTYREAVIEKWTREDRIANIYMQIERGALQDGRTCGKELVAKRKKKSARFAR